MFCRPVTVLDVGGGWVGDVCRGAGGREDLLFGCRGGGGRVLGGAVCVVVSPCILSRRGLGYDEKGVALR
jgi:hypothetical protein